MFTADLSLRIESPDFWDYKKNEEAYEPAVKEITDTVNEDILKKVCFNHFY